MKASNLELIQPIMGNSFFIQRYEGSKIRKKQINWHFHPEIEIVFVLGGNGIRYVGNHNSPYENGDLVLIGPNLPHRGFTDKNTRNKEEIVIQFQENFAGKEIYNLNETQAIKELLERSKYGISFHGQTKENVGKAISTLPGLHAFERFTGLLNILNALAISKEYNILNPNSLIDNSEKPKSQRISDIFQYIKSNYQSNINLEEIASISLMTPSSFCRYFKKTTNKTFTQFLNEYRIIEACKLLVETDFPIGEISSRVGYNSIAHFNKHFKMITKKTPKVYRKFFEKNKVIK